MNKYELTGETTEFIGKTLYRIIACKTFGDVIEGEKRGVTPLSIECKRR